MAVLPKPWMDARLALARRGLVALHTSVLRNGGGNMEGSCSKYNGVAPRSAKRDQRMCSENTEEKNVM
jgi:hypothetical protein